jgi:hypothetical protein
MTARQALKRLSFLARFLYVQRVRGFPAPDPVPHLDEEAARRFAAQLRTSSFYLEYGSGGSTILADRLGVRTVSVESDRFYAKAVRKSLAPESSVQLVVADIGPTRDLGRPLFRRPEHWKRYVRAPFCCFGQDFPDFILIDGRFRVACALEVARRAHLNRSTSLLMVDDYDARPHYHILEKYLGSADIVGRAAFFSVGQQEISELTVEEHLQDIR